MTSGVQGPKSCPALPVAQITRGQSQCHLARTALVKLLEGGTGMRTGAGRQCMCYDMHDAMAPIDAMARPARGLASWLDSRC
jgi:hypothetical protein